jgi:F-type H+-transporting ATPase subunit a
MHGFNWFTFFSPRVNEDNIHVVTALFVAALLIGASLLARRRLLRLEQSLVPEGRLTLTNLFEIIVENILSLMEGIIGPSARQHLPLVGTLFIFIFTSNLLGLIPGFLPPTANVNTNLAMALCVFLYFNFFGIKEQGLVNYLKHFAGPIWWLAPLIFAIEFFGVALRPLTLSLRLLANINADHLVVGIFSNLVPIIVPVVFMILGVFIAFVQAFVFTLLTMIYIALATAHEEH